MADLVEEGAHDGGVLVGAGGRGDQVDGVGGAGERLGVEVGLAGGVEGGGGAVGGEDPVGGGPDAGQLAAVGVGDPGQQVVGHGRRWVDREQVEGFPGFAAVDPFHDLVEAAAVHGCGVKEGGEAGRRRVRSSAGRRRTGWVGRRR